jgi:glycosyltransferase involved in cell wall biosynthesis
LLRTFPHLSPEKINVIYEGVSNRESRIANLKSPAPYLLYIGSAYPHKNIALIFKALQKLTSSPLKDLKLKLVSSRSVFLDKLQSEAQRLGVGDRVEFLGYQTDDAIQTLFHQALALVHPSFSEGFGLTGLEAMAASCPVIASTATCLPEIYGDAALYFDPHSAVQLIDQIQQLCDHPKIRQDIIARGIAQSQKYSWTNTATQTIAVYNSIINR